MGKKGKGRLALFCIVTVLLTGAPGLEVSAATENYTQDSNGRLIQIPAAYEVSASIKNFGEYGFLNHPEDIFVDRSGFIYVADTGNNRVLKMTLKGEVVLEITQVCGSLLKSPKGVFADSDGSIWIADTGNLRIAVTESDGTDRREYLKPESTLLEANFSFDIEKIFVNKMGYIFALKGANLMRIDSGNNFQGYMGATQVGFSLSRFLIKTFGTREQIERTRKQAPVSYKNVMIANDGSIYGVLASGTTGQIRRLNSIGENTFVELPFGYTIQKEDTKNADAKTQQSKVTGEDVKQTRLLQTMKPMLYDITVFDSGIVTVIDGNTGLIYQYDQEGNLLTSFGGIGDTRELFQYPVSIASDVDDNLYVLDNTAGAIKVFEPTKFIRTVHQAIVYQNDGRYDEELECWKDVLAIEANYSLAHNGMGKIAYKNGDYQESMRQYRLGDSKDGYSKSFARYRHGFFRKYFGWLMLGVALGVFGVGKLFAVAKRRSDKWCYEIEMKGDIQ